MEAFDVWKHNDRILNGRAAEGNESISSIQCPAALQSSLRACQRG
ncbi:hypothetical protein ALO36_103753 [Pseudomonas syringae pv. tomato]|uniref:Uncharacterized protein n=1 Tax=Pseudomonas syringae pv. maculicola TaxID=59511 RepID=A0A0N0X3Q6_PSEYM|nr:Unknown protein sequence [Pseudomonas syringae pv. maculicola str. M6]KPC18810.1 Unknown protein sequence [Pseudomonas syringae pv. maculicola]KPW47464.1 hypothetical protein ALO86_102090 [Pseudomonas syringae pv. berberidis]KPY09659.1 hypothetical protein ALO54_102351 [Pseudomonas syringae pv. philadelphi]KPY97098.1 hypothetical protein ALO36_103753 [Pseudomonas syringae pv. tomato]RMM11109.1 hypothetical protein ALQ85_102413 [Pseudomonas syringae]